MGKSMEAAELKREMEALRVRTPRCPGGGDAKAGPTPCIHTQMDCNALELNNGHLARRKEELEAQVGALQAASK